MHLSKGTSLKFGSYVIESVLGQGGFGITYVAEQVGLGRKVAIKEFFMKELCDRDEETLGVTTPSSGSRELVDKFRMKFIKEAQMISEFKHPNIVSIYDIFEENGTAYYVMEYHDGGSLSSLSLPLPVAEAVRYIRQVASALSYLHKRNVMHLDVKPANILIDSEGNAVLIDFGISKRYDESGGQTSSTPVGVSNGYAPIEQYGRTVSKFTPATDVYSLGATFYKLLTGTTPPEASILVCEPDILVIPSSMPKRFAELIRKCLKPNVSGRPQSIDEFINVLDGYVEPSILEIKPPKKGFEQEISDDETEMPTVAPANVKKVAPVSPVPSSKKKRSRRWLWMVLIAGVLAVGAFIVFMKLKADHEQYVKDHTRDLCLRMLKASDPEEFEDAWRDYDDWYSGLSSHEKVFADASYYEYAGEVSEQRERFTSVQDTMGTCNGYQWVDLGLPSGLKWATHNMYSYAAQYSWGYWDEWGGGWRIPTDEEFQELIDECSWHWTTRDGYEGYEIVGNNDNSIFLPAVEDGIGTYWSSTLCERDNFAYNLYFSLGEYYIDHNYRSYALSVRPVLDE